DLISEVLLLRQLRHPNILPFLGINDEVLSPSFSIITPWMYHGNLSIYLKHVPCSLRRKVELVRQVVEGVRYLHTQTPPVIHCDIKAGNVLVSEDETCCIGDFGLSIIEKTSNEFGTLAVGDHTDSSSGVRGSLRWLAPELLGPYALHSARSKSTRDIYALGCTILEVISGYPPFYDEKNEIKIMIDVLNG
ncbi:kinase-like protein, partial [Marasmius fiardii PR-910]